MKPSETKPGIESGETAKDDFSLSEPCGQVLQGAIQIRGFRDRIVVHAFGPGLNIASGEAKLPPQFAGDINELSLTVPVFVDPSVRQLLTTKGIDVTNLSVIEALGKAASNFAKEATVPIEVPPSPEQSPASYERTIDLGPERPVGYSSVFDGVELGRELRKKFNLDALDDAETRTRIRIPLDTLLLTDEFFDGLLGNSVRKLGYFFNKRYEFDCASTLLPLLERQVNRYGRFGL